MKHDTASPCTAYDDMMGVCGGAPTERYVTGTRCRTCAPGATLDACQHGTPWTQACGRCEGEPPAPSTVESPSARRRPHPYGHATTDPAPLNPCPRCTRPRSKGHKGACV